MKIYLIIAVMASLLLLGCINPQQNTPAVNVTPDIPNISGLLGPGPEINNTIAPPVIPVNRSINPLCANHENVYKCGDYLMGINTNDFETTFYSTSGNKTVCGLALGNESDECWMLSTLNCDSTNLCTGEYECFISEPAVDAHGCELKLNQTWCSSKNKCIGACNESCPDTQEQAYGSCNQPNVEEAFICEGYYYVVSSLPGAGSMYRIVDGSTVHCPLVNPVDMSEECRDFMDNPKNCSENVCTGQ